MRQTQRRIAILSALAIAACGIALAGFGNVDELRFGTAVNAKGEVPAEAHANEFAADAKILVTLRVQESPKGTPLMLSILDRETEELVWSDERTVAGGPELVRFDLKSIRPGKFRAKVKLGTDWVAEHEFKVE